MPTQAPRSPKELTQAHRVIDAPKSSTRLLGWFWKDAGASLAAPKMRELWKPLSAFWPPAAYASFRGPLGDSEQSIFFLTCIEGSLQVKSPTIWIDMIDEKQRRKSEKRRAEQVRESQEKRCRCTTATATTPYNTTLHYTHCTPQHCNYNSSYNYTCIVLHYSILA